MNKASRFFSILLMSLLLPSCFRNNEMYYLNGIANGTGFDNIAKANVLYFYSNITGMDSSGPLYYVLDYSEVDELVRFNNTVDKRRTLTDGRNENLETVVNSYISKWLSDIYSKLDEKYKIDWNKPYKYYSTYEEYVGCVLIYYENDGLLYALYDQS
ncbi:MAG: hypothetical protein K6E21_02810 [Bacilli bacterium]|nr:hypothetical protein [Bacilli bacterium]